MKTSVMRNATGQRGIFFPVSKHIAESGPHFVFFLLLLCIVLAAQVRAEPLPSLVAPGHAGWKEKVFSGQTRYCGGSNGLLMAESNGTASGLFFEGRVDVERTPWLAWSWKVDNVLEGVNEREKAGDDYPARIYVVINGGLAFWKTKALSYVWASKEPADSMWPNAFTANAYMIAVRSGNAMLGDLVTEKRNVRDDWFQAFGEEISYIDAVAIMTDTDNSGQSARAWYGQPEFLER